MKILYGVQGTGNGHTTRARVMAKAFSLRKDIQVDYLFSGREKNKYFDMQVFGDFASYRGLSFETRGGKISQYETLKAAKIGELYRDIKTVRAQDYDLIINDFEPISAWAAKLNKIPSISISHQAAFMHPIPKHEGTLFDRLITQYFAPTDLQLGVHWYHFGHAIMPPFIEADDAKNPLSRTYLVYLPFEEIADVSALLDSFSEHDFVCFHPKIEVDHQIGNISWRCPSKMDFLQVLQTCSGVIANAGFELASECLHFGKKLLIKPLSGQFEQLSNAKTLMQLGLGQSMATLDTDIVEEWLLKPAIERIEYPQNPDILIDWLLKRDWQAVDSLCEQLWSKVRFPQSVITQLDKLPVISR
ncbi:MJ1255/VC2487 family glycosyltransferase [Paraglaciecola sp. 20A4]|uniref:MJ1255/VC2487 family glycosyltransferase n=1 Tax=Paraglaciecola sp. 20A4 TaxID=2687288 RepID=UPI00140D815A|nr:MJ1255/VC2487 family glycosyltransferase [Paraglaciecola sp. 20A4]